jgi:EAL domain-containing protein (putative c-di-GMP-specific phosphodiesterase class I)
VVAADGPGVSTQRAGLRPPTEPDQLDRVLAERSVRSVYQPIVELDSGAVVGYEALARGPAGSPLEGPQALFEAARASGRLADVDRACRSAAFSGALDAGLSAPWTLFVNLEPETADVALPLRPDGVEERATARAQVAAPRVVMELTERALTANPTHLLHLVDRIRTRGWGIALDDVGAERDSLALLPLLRPDVIKLDLRLVQRRPTLDIAEIVSAVNAEAERAGSVILAEGIETEAHLAVARSLGARLGQGWLLGRPAPLPGPLSPFTGGPIRLAGHGGQVPLQTPFELGARRLPPRPAAKTLLIEVSKHLENQAMRSGESTVVLAAFQQAAFFTPATRRRYARLLAHAAFVGVLGAGMAAAPMAGIRGGVLLPTDPLIGEWDIAVVGPHYAATLVARDLGDGGVDAERRFEFVLSHDRDLAVSVATALMSRIWSA